ncbi:MAG: hypothetical protein ACKOFU_00875 [Actinomycetota bacterium]
MKKPGRSRSIRWPKTWRKSLWVIPGLGLLVKFIIIAQIPGNGWLGADGENYLEGLEFLIRDGFLSQERILHYWPAGYPLLMWVLGAPNHQLILPIMGVLQSILFAFSTAYFGQKLQQTALRKFSLPSVFVLTISPTLALNTIAIGYELISASIFLIVLGLFIDLKGTEKPRLFDIRLITMGLLFSLNSFVQPRFLLSAFLFFVLAGYFIYEKRLVLPVVAIGMICSLLLPSILIVRNVLANDFTTISTNLGITMRIGAGEGATGGYVPGFAGVECPSFEGNAAEVDQSIVRCTIDWYLDNPSEVLRLSWNKSIYFWSPWFGPLANGSMARNPWLKLNPFYDVATQTKEGFDFVYGDIGKLVSWLWLMGYLGAMTLGAIRLRKHSAPGKELVVLISTLIIANWLVSLGTLGDHRQRLPILTMVIFLQIVGIFSIKRSSKRTPQKKR